MLVAFNKYGTVTRLLTHGTPARQGVSSGFELTCYFAGREITNSNLVTIQIRKPSGQVLCAPIPMEYNGNYTFNRLSNDDINTVPFVNGGTYHVHTFAPDSSTIFNEYGVYEATISVYTTSSADSPKLVEGLVKIPVQRSAVSPEENSGVLSSQSYMHYVTVADTDGNALYLRIISDSDEPINTGEKLYQYAKATIGNRVLGGSWEYDPVSFNQWFVTDALVITVRMDDHVSIEYWQVRDDDYVIINREVEISQVIDVQIMKV